MIGLRVRVRVKVKVSQFHALQTNNTMYVVKHASLEFYEVASL